MAAMTPAMGGASEAMASPRPRGSATRDTTKPAKMFLGNAPIVNATSSNYMAKVAGIYTVKVTNVTNCATTSSCSPVTVKASPTAYITYNTPLSFCDGSLVVLTAVVGNNITYQWRKNGIDYMKLNDIQKDALIEIANISFGNSLTSLNLLLI